MSETDEQRYDTFIAQIGAATKRLTIPREKLDRLLAENLVVREYCDLLGNLIVSIDAWFAGTGKDVIDIEERWPSDWWQAFKERWFPRWALKRWPVRYKQISVHRVFWRACCPHLPVEEPSSHLKFLMQHGAERLVAPTRSKAIDGK